MAMKAVPMISKPENPASQSLFLLARNQREEFLRHFGLRESPFGVTPDPEFLFWSPQHNAALRAMIAAIESNLGFSVLLGKPGTGKTSLLFHLLAQYRESARTAFIFQTQCRPHDLIRHIASELELPLSRRDDVFLHQRLNGMLLKEARAGRKVLIIIDEAQNLQEPSLEAIRLLSDFETGPSKLLNVVLSGSTRLGETLLSPELSQLAQRISTICRLEPLTEQEVRDYVRYRLSVVCSRPATGIFSPESLAEVTSRSEGVPRIINAICYRALILAYTQGLGSVNRKLVKDAARDLDLAEPGVTESRPSLQFSPSNGVPYPVAPFRKEQQPEPPAHTFARAVPMPGADATSFARANQIPTSVNDPRIDSKHPTVPDKAEQGGRFGMLAFIRFKNAGWHSRRSTWSVAAVLLLALGFWAGWNEFRGKPDASGVQLFPSQPEPSKPEAQPAKMDVEGGVPHSGALRPDEPAAPANSTTSQSPRIQTQSVIDMDPNLILPSKIHLQSSTLAESQAPNTTVSVSKVTDGLAPLAATASPARPRLEAENMSGNSRKRGNFSFQPVHVVQPEYPDKARLARIEGSVEVELTIDQSGSVQKVRGMNGNPILLQAAEEAARQWKYPPFSADSTTLPAVTLVKFNFKLDSGTRQ
jgi:TonB family protein